MAKAAVKARALLAQRGARGTMRNVTQPSPRETAGRRKKAAAVEMAAEPWTPPPGGEAWVADLAECEVAPENPRFGQPVEDLDAMAASLRAHGQLQPVLAYREGDRFFIFEGGRRLAGLAAAGMAAADVLVYPKAQAVELALAASIERVDMHAADQALLFARLADRGMEPAVIAGRFGRRERYVRQRIGLSRLHPPILKALRADAITLDQAAAWTSVPEGRQAALWKRLGGDASPRSILAEAKDGAVRADDPLAVFVGVEAYEAAGGGVERDLFCLDSRAIEAAADDEAKLAAASTWLTDRALVERLVTDRIAAAKAELEEAGWGWVEYRQHGAFGQWGGDREFTKAAGAPPKSADKRAGRGAVVSIGKDGALKTEVNLERTADVEKRAKAEAKARARGAIADAGGDDGEDPGGEATSRGAAEGADGARRPSSTGEEEAPAKPELTNLGHAHVTAAAGHIVMRAIAHGADCVPGGSVLPLICITAHLARLHWRDAEFTRGKLLALERPWQAGRVVPGLADDERMTEMGEKYRSALEAEADTHGSLEAAFGRWSAEALTALLAWLLDRFVNTVEARPAEAVVERRAALSALGGMAGAVPELAFTVDAEFTAMMSKPALEAACREMGIAPGKTKALTADIVANAAPEKGWVPPLLRRLTGVPMTAKETAEAAFKAPGGEG